jgi:hypothetical protein
MLITSIIKTEDQITLLDFLMLLIGMLFQKII